MKLILLFGMLFIAGCVDFPSLRNACIDNAPEGYTFVATDVQNSCHYESFGYLPYRECARTFENTENHGLLIVEDDCEIFKTETIITQPIETQPIETDVIGLGKKRINDTFYINSCLFKVKNIEEFRTTEDHETAYHGDRFLDYHPSIDHIYYYLYLIELNSNLEYKLINGNYDEEAFGDSINNACNSTKISFDFANRGCFDRGNDTIEPPLYLCDVSEISYKMGD